MQPEISIIIPIYKVESYLYKCLHSIRRQTFSDFEVLMINDGSPDHCENICKDFVLADRRFKYFYQENRGVSSARNLGLDHASGQYIVFIDPDDYVDEDYLLDFVKNVEDFDTLVIQDIVREQEGEIQNIFGFNSVTTYDLVTDFCDLTSNDSLLEGFACNKFYVCSILSEHHLRFNELCTHREDEIFFHQYLPYLKKLKFLPVANYHYVFRSDSAMRRFPACESERRFLDHFLKFLIFLRSTVKNRECLDQYHYKRINLYYRYLLYSILYSGKNLPPCSERLGILAFVHRILPQIKHWLRLTPLQKVDLFLIKRRLFWIADFVIYWRRRRYH